MKSKEFISKLDDAQIVSAIGAAEKRTSGEIRVFVTHRSPADVLKEAGQDFARLKMDQTKERNGVLLLVAPEAQKFALYGDIGIHQKCGEAFWNRLRDEVAEHFKRENFTQAILHAVNTVGDELAKYFPAIPGDENQLPNSIVRD